MHAAKLKYIIPLCWSIVFLSACTEYIELEPGDFEQRIVIDATVTNELGFHPVIISKTRTIDQETTPYISNAKVQISTADTLIAYTESDSLPGYYFPELAYTGMPGTRYTLDVFDVDVNGDGLVERYSAESTMGNYLEIDSIGYIYIPRWEAVALTCYAYDPPETNYYNFRAWINGVLTTDTIYEFSITDDLLFNGNYTNGVQCAYFQDEYTDEFVQQGDTLTLGIENIDEAYFNYIATAISEYYGYNPIFGGMPANIEGNISNGALGIFRVYTISKKSVVVHEVIPRSK